MHKSLSFLFASFIIMLTCFAQCKKTDDSNVSHKKSFTGTYYGTRRLIRNDATADASGRHVFYQDSSYVDTLVVIQENDSEVIVDNGHLESYSHGITFSGGNPHYGASAVFPENTDSIYYESHSRGGGGYTYNYDDIMFTGKKK